MDFDAVVVGEKMIVLFGVAIYTLNIKGNKVDTKSLSTPFRKILLNEFAQMFEAAWS